eukprot:3556977-Alexandrium_andersonii.AAC.1
MPAGPGHAHGHPGAGSGGARRIQSEGQRRFQRGFNASCLPSPGGLLPPPGPPRKAPPAQGAGGALAPPEREGKKVLQAHLKP